MLGNDPPNHPKFFEIPPALSALNGRVKGIEDCSFPLGNPNTPPDYAAMALC